jgi:hypothetical protein
MFEAMGLKEYGNEVTFNGMTSLLNFIQSTDSKVITGGYTDGRLDRQTTW